MASNTAHEGGASDFSKDVLRLREVLSETPTIARMDAQSDLAAVDTSKSIQESEVLALALLDIAESSAAIVERVEGLLTGTAVDVEDELIEIFMELQHILYHVHDSRFLRLAEESVESDDN